MPQGEPSPAGPDRISEAEHAVMEVLWSDSPQTASAVCDAVCADRGWSAATVKTLLSRLVQKGALTTTPDGRRYLYTPAIERRSYVGAESKRLMQRLFGGKPASLLAHMAEEEALTEADIAEIERLLQDLRK